MRPIRLVMTAFGPYAGEQVIDFRELGGSSIFLIHGPTGGGKTTILDALCYALYGDTSGNERLGEQMRSHMAAAGMPTSVVLDFSLGEKSYRVTRKPAQERPRKKGEGTTTEPTSATLWDRSGIEDDEQEGVILAAQATKVTERVEALLGFRSEQFRQVILLPQDKFRELLSADSRQREEILQTLFQTEFYERVQEALKAKAKEIDQKSREVEQFRKAMLEQAGAQTLQGLLEQRQTKTNVLAALEAQIDPMRAAEKVAQEALTIGDQAHVKLKECKEAAKALAAVEAQAGQRALWQKAADTARRAAGLAADEVTLAACTRDAKERRSHLMDAEKALAAAQRKAADAHSARQAEELRQPEAQRLRERAARLSSLREPVKQLEQMRRDLTASEQKLKQAEESLARLQAEQKENLRQLEARRQQLASDMQLAAGHQGNVLAARQAADHVRLRKELDTAASARATAEKSQRERVEQEKRGIAVLEKAKGELESLREAHIAGQAGVLARDLASGIPCPVCGSIEHPHPAQAGDQIPSKEQVAKKQKELERIEKGLEDVRAILRSAGDAAASARAVEAERATALGEAASQPLPALEAAFGEKQSAAQASEAAIIRARELTPLCHGLDEKAKAAESAVERQRAQRQSAADAASAARAVFETTQKELPPELRTEASLAQASAAVDAELAGMEARLKKASQSAAEANTSLAAAREAHGKAGEENHRADGALGEAQKRFSEQRTAAGFASDEEYRAARLADAQVRELEESIARHDRALSAAHDRNGRAVLAAAGLTAPNLPALQLSLREAKYKLEQAIGQRKTLEHDLGQLDRCVEKLRTLAEQAAEYEKQYTVYGTLAEAALGKNDQGMAFQRFVLAFLLDDVLVAATARLKIMSRGRYQLQRQRERADRRGASGLELEVFDSFTGASRAVATLSGGEGFLASLSLALGLADVVQSYAGGIRMETVFIDEGFGSLDSESLDLAIRALEDLLRGGRLVGIISHVTELRERIAARLEVTGSQSGSSARFVVGTTAAEGMITRAAGRPRW